MQDESVLPSHVSRFLLTDGGLETTLVFHDGIDLPHFAAYTLLFSEQGRGRLRRYYEGYLDIAAESGSGFVLESPTWRASADWGARLGHGAEEIAAVNRSAIALLSEIRESRRGSGMAMVVSGQIGPRGDGYSPGAMMSPAEAADYHSAQIRAFRDAGADLATALTINYIDEAIGIVEAARTAGIPSVISFTVETDGRLPSGEPLAGAIERVDEMTDGGPAYIDALGAHYAALIDVLPNLRVLGGCCGTDERHVRAIAAAVNRRREAT